MRLSQRDFAKKLGVSFATVARWESGRVQASPLAVDKLKRLMEEDKKAI
jgi:DNA-binding transcriptional regulator YiaG